MQLPSTLKPATWCTPPPPPSEKLMYDSPSIAWISSSLNPLLLESAPWVPSSLSSLIYILSDSSQIPDIHPLPWISTLLFPIYLDFSFFYLLCKFPAGSRYASPHLSSCFFFSVSCQCSLTHVQVVGFHGNDHAGKAYRLSVMIFCKS